MCMYLTARWSRHRRYITSHIRATLNPNTRTHAHTHGYILYIHMCVCVCVYVCVSKHKFMFCYYWDPLCVFGSHIDRSPRVDYEVLSMFKRIRAQRDCKRQ